MLSRRFVDRASRRYKGAAKKSDDSKLTKEEHGLQDEKKESTRMKVKNRMRDSIQRERALTQRGQQAELIPQKKTINYASTSEWKENRDAMLSAVCMCVCLQHIPRVVKREP